ncbi:hypothetical protein COY28_05060 [Candidatus Woesearchaeota archaeon CG_4_10_14_0_2_um_filter_57_5]|nr:MAG: hypothetical protein AUJ68_03070 [Candidatus Woesearchaeota archaeon CG1_02_57_44]PIZ51354.1 MAG: hypothetical protein COY28_05060 [Candidatus Woesearchaeota archaeon CG_4_10_14_0_2_um_filter_57_5]
MPELETYLDYLLQSEGVVLQPRRWFFEYGVTHQIDGLFDPGEGIAELEARVDVLEESRIEWLRQRRKTVRGQSITGKARHHRDMEFDPDMDTDTSALFTRRTPRSSEHPWWRYEVALRPKSMGKMTSGILFTTDPYALGATMVAEEENIAYETIGMMVPASLFPEGFTCMEGPLIGFSLARPGASMYPRRPANGPVNVTSINGDGHRLLGSLPGAGPSVAHCFHDSEGTGAAANVLLEAMGYLATELGRHVRDPGDGSGD